MFSQRLKDARRAAGQTQAEVAAHIYITQQAYARYEIGASTPNPETLAAIAKVLNVTADYLCGNADYIKLEPRQKLSDQDLAVALFGTDKNIAPDVLLQVRRYAEALLKNISD